MVLYVLTAFGDVLTSDRADSLLLLFAAAGLLCVARSSGLWALAANGVSFALYPTTVLVIPGLTWAAVAARAGWRKSGTGLAVALLGAVGAFAGPAGSWLVAGAGLCAVLMGKAAVIAWRQRRATA